MTELLPGLPTVQCPECHQRVVPGYSGELVPMHLPPSGGRKPCPGEGAEVRVTGSGLVAVQPDPAGEAGG